MSGIYREVLAPERLVFTFAWEEDGKRGLETLVTVTFAEQDGKTKLTFHQAAFDLVEQRDFASGGLGRMPRPPGRLPDQPTIESFVTLRWRGRSRTDPIT